MADILQVWRDPETRSAGRQMVIDHRLLRDAMGPVIRFYGWAEPAITIGYFVSESEVRVANPGLEVARRETGGGIVEHGEDVTFALAVPRSAAEKTGGRFESLLKAPVAERYRWIHERLASALQSSGIAASVASPDFLQSDEGEAGRCFSGPVLSDIVDPGNGRKIAGGAQRRTRAGWLHQGSVRLDPPDNRIDAEWTRAFCEELAGGPERVEWLESLESLA